MDTVVDTDIGGMSNSFLEQMLSYRCLVGNGWEWNGIIIDSSCGSFPHSLLSRSKFCRQQQKKHVFCWDRKRTIRSIRLNIPCVPPAPRTGLVPLFSAGFAARTSKESIDAADGRVIFQHPNTCAAVMGSLVHGSSLIHGWLMSQPDAAEFGK